MEQINRMCQNVPQVNNDKTEVMVYSKEDLRISTDFESRGAKNQRPCPKSWCSNRLQSDRYEP